MIFMFLDKLRILLHLEQRRFADGLNSTVCGNKFYFYFLGWKVLR